MTPDTHPTQGAGIEELASEVARMREIAADWRRPALAQVEGPGDLKIYGKAIADDIDRWADMLAALAAKGEGFHSDPCCPHCPPPEPYGSPQMAPTKTVCDTCSGHGYWRGGYCPSCDGSVARA